MSDEKKVSEKKEKQSSAASQAVADSVYGDKPKREYRGRGRGRSDRRQKEAPRDEFEQRILDLARVTRVMAGGKRMNFRACVVIGDRKGKIGIGLGKGADVTIAVNKAVNKAKKNLITVNIVNETIPHEVSQKTGAAKIILKPAGTGKGIIAGGVARMILELAGIKNVTSKQLGTNNKVNNARCTIEALKSLKNISNPKAKKVAVTEEQAPVVAPASK
ncbi:MAG: 30S ribosomal protein S5 [Candidatus Parcubacteria bacterium]|jgi:small subunit ribosomal protein S5|nr:MAG: hypothetical protein JST_3740 [Candidatus Parcubacteria bacterium]